MNARERAAVPGGGTEPVLRFCICLRPRTPPASARSAIAGLAFPPPADAPGTQRSAWLGSLSAERRPRRRQASLLDVSMIVSVIIALTAMAVWFFAFAHNTGPLPE